MAQFSDCITVSPGMFVGPGDDPDPPGPGVSVHPAPGDYEKAGPEPWFDDEPPLDPPYDIVYPGDIYITVPEVGGGSTGTTLTGSTETLFFPWTVFNLPDAPSSSTTFYDTDHVITLPAPGSGPGPSFEDNIIEMEMHVVGPGLTDIPDDITAKIINFPAYNTSVPSFEITFPTTEEAKAWYATNPDGFLWANFDIVYVVNLPDDDPDVGYFQVYRHRITVGTHLTIQLTSNNTPQIEYPSVATAYYNSTQPDTVIQPLEDQYELNGNTITDWDFTLIPANTDYDIGDISFNPLNGFITLKTVAGNLNTPLLGIRLNLEFSTADNQQKTIAITSIDEGVPAGPPEFSWDGQEGVVNYGNNNPLPTTITPNPPWNFNGNDYDEDNFIIYSVTIGQGCATGDPGNCWPGGVVDGISDTVHFNLETGVITLDPWIVDEGHVGPSDFPGDTLQIIFEWISSDDSANNIFVDVTIPISYVIWQGMTAGGGPGTTTVMSKNTGLPIVLPSGYSSLRGVKPRGRTITKGILGKGRGFFKTARSIPSPPDQVIKKLKYTRYFDGIRNTNFTFFDNFSPSPFIAQEGSLPLDYSVTAVPPKESIFSNSFDFTLGGIKSIHQNPNLYDDFVYNALTTEKIKKSLSAPVRAALSFKYNLDGSRLIDSFTKTILANLVANEDTFTKEDIEVLAGLATSRRVTLDSLASNNYVTAVNLFLNNSKSLDISRYNIPNQNRLINWKILAEDINKNIVLKTADLTETKIYIPNSEIISVFDATGGSHSLEMQDGDYFIAAPVTGDERLSVFSDRYKAVVLSPEDKAAASRLCNSLSYMELTCTSLESNLIELNVDTTGARQDYYFLSLDKSTIEDIPSDSMFFRTTTATYNYMTDEDEINSFVKYKLPYNIVTLRSDDIIFNHLESSLKAQVVFNNFSVNNFTNIPDERILVRDLPWYIFVIPSDKPTVVPSLQRSQMKAFNSRTIKLEMSSFNNANNSLPNPPFLNEDVTTTGGINFGIDIVNNTIYQENREYSVDFPLLKAVSKYKNDAEKLPRKLHPTNEILNKIKEIKTEKSLTDKDSITFFDIYSRLLPQDFRSLSLDQSDYNSFLSKLRINKVAETNQINKDNFVPIKEVSVISKGSTGVLPSDSSIIFSKTKTATPGAADEASRPDDRGGIFGT